MFTRCGVPHHEPASLGCCAGRCGPSTGGTKRQKHTRGNNIPEAITPEEEEEEKEEDVALFFFNVLFLRTRCTKRNYVAIGQSGCLTSVVLCSSEVDIPKATTTT